MKYIFNKVVDPFFNLALEEYVFDNANDDVIIFWQNPNTLVVGRYQKTFEVVNSKYVPFCDTNVVRRLTGGGTEYHDYRNISYSVISSCRKSRMSSYHKLIEAISDIAGNYGNEIFDHAHTVKKNRELHHGTILCNTNIELTESALRAKLIQPNVNKTIYQEVRTLPERQKPKNRIEKFIIKLIYHIEREFGAEKHQLSDFDLLEITKLARNKYETWEWNYGSDLKFNFVRKANFAGREFEVYATVEDGIIRNISFFGNFNASQELQHVLEMLEGTKIDYENLLPKTVVIASKLFDVTGEQLAWLIAS